MQPPPDENDPTLLYRQVAALGQALASPKRLQLLMLLSQAEKPVSRLATQTGQSVAAVSAQLQALKRAGLAIDRRDGKRIGYRLSDPAVLRLVGQLLDTAQAVLPAARAVVDQFLDDPDTLVPLSAKQVADEVKAGRVVLIDLRPDDEYAAGHLAGARSVPAATVARRLDELQSWGDGAELMGYCRGPYCLTGAFAVRHAREHGVAMKRLPLGVNEWRASRRKVVAGIDPWD